MSMTIVREYGINGDKKLRYNLLEAAGTNLSDMNGQRVKITAYILTEDTNGTETTKTLKMISEDGEFIGTRSQSFIAGFERFLACMESDECDEFEVVQMKSRNGRNYLTFKA